MIEDDNDHDCGEDDFDQPCCCLFNVSCRGDTGGSATARPTPEQKVDGGRRGFGDEEEEEEKEVAEANEEGEAALL